MGCDCVEFLQDIENKSKMCQSVINCSLVQEAPQAQRLPLGEAVTKNGSSEPVLVTDEGQTGTNFTKQLPYLVQDLPSSAPVCALGHLPPGEGFVYFKLQFIYSNGFD